MPRLVYCGYYWRVASDELALPSIFAAVLRTFWVAALAAIFAEVHHRLQECSSRWVVLIYFVLSLAAFLASIGVEIAIILESFKGTPSEPEKRRNIPRFLTMHVVLGMVQVFCVVYGFCLLASDTIACSNRVDGPVTTILLAVVVLSQLVDIVLTICCSACFRSFSVTQSQLRMTIEHVENVRLWEKRCKSCCKWLQLCTCNLFGGTNIPEDLEAVARVLAQVLHHEGMLDLVPSDLVAALILVRYLQRKKDQELKRRLVGNRSAEDAIKNSLHNISSRSLEADLYQNEVKGTQPVVETLDGTMVTQMLGAPEYVKLSSQNHFHRALDHVLLMRSSKHDTALMKVLALHARHALAIYTWMIQVYMYPCTGCCRLPCLACYCWQNDNHGPSFRRVIGDNMFGTHEGALLRLAGLQRTEIVYANFSNDVDQKPYAVIVNHEHRMVVITIRGTMSFEDCITDAFAEPADLTDYGRKWNFDGEGKFAHGGIVRAAAWIRRELDETRLLKMLLHGAPNVLDDITDPLAPAAAQMNCVGYRLHVVGHSLGAGTACILGLMLQSEFPDVHVFGYGMPGGLMDADTVRATRRLVTTIILGNDLVARLTIESITKLRNDMLEALARAKVNKNKIFTSIFKNTTAEELMYLNEDPPENDFYATVKRYVNLLHQRDLERQQTSLSLPGRIVYFAKTQNVRRFCCFHQRSYTPVIGDPNEFTELVVSPTMAVDHFPDRYFLVLNEIWNGWADASPHAGVAPAYTGDSKPEDFLA